MEHITGKKSAANYFLLYKKRNIKDTYLSVKGRSESFTGVNTPVLSAFPSSTCLRL